MSKARDLPGGRYRLVSRNAVVVGVILATRGDATVPTAPGSGPLNQPIVTYSPEACS